MKDNMFLSRSLFFLSFFHHHRKKRIILPPSSYNNYYLLFCFITVAPDLPERLVTHCCCTSPTFPPEG